MEDGEFAAGNDAPGLSGTSRYDVYKGLVPVAWIIAFGFVMLCTYPDTRALAGKHTSFSLSIAVTVTVALTIAATAGLGYAIADNKRLRRENDRLDRRLRSKEREIRNLKGGTP